MNNVLSDPNFYVSLTAILTAIGGTLYNNSQISSLQETDVDLKKKIATLTIMVSEQHKKTHQLEEINNIIPEIKSLLDTQSNKTEQLALQLNLLIDYLNIIILKNNEVIEYLNTNNNANLKPIKLKQEKHPKSNEKNKIISKTNNVNKQQNTTKSILKPSSNRNSHVSFNKQEQLDELDNMN